MSRVILHLYTSRYIGCLHTIYTSTVCEVSTLSLFSGIPFGDIIIKSINKKKTSHETSKKEIPNPVWGVAAPGG
jgi:hypothetical protein